MPRLDKQYLLGVKINTCFKNFNDLLGHIENNLLANKAANNIISTTNVEFIMDAQDDLEFQNLINSASLSIPDGYGVLYGLFYLQILDKIHQKDLPKVVFILVSFLAGIFLPILYRMQKTPNESLTGISLVEHLVALSHLKGYTLCLLGGWPKDIFGKRVQTDIDVATIATQNLLKKYPKARIIASTSQFSHKEYDDTATLSFIHNCMLKSKISHIDFVLVGYGHKNQEKWLIRNMAYIPASVGIGVGGSFDVYAKLLPKVPLTLRKLHLEWFFRLLVQPWRVKRILKAFPYYPMYLFHKYVLQK
ncbi:MAG: WecB/TagA/CpsF family glycosyltransferase [Patescibacteria group bacterium]